MKKKVNKRKKKVDKEKLKRKKYKIVFISLFCVGVISFFVINNAKPKYFNNVNKSLCSKGYYYNYFSAIFGSGCTKCSKGQYCPDGNKNYNCKNGTTTKREGSQSEKDCNVCKDGKKWFNGTSCVVCQAPYYCENGERKTCEKGKTITKNGATSKSDCVSLGCKKSEYINKSGKCEICPLNYYCNGVDAIACNNRVTTAKGQTSKDACVCKNGTYDTGYYCITCPVNSYCVGGKEYKCPNGKITNGTGKSSSSDCYTKPTPTPLATPKCFSGQYMKNGKCIPCEKGHYCKNGNMYICTGNTYQENTGGSSCIECPKNKVPNSDHTKCIKKCKDGQYLKGNKCYNCHAGYYCIDSKEIPCGYNEYQNKAGKNYCNKCKKGTMPNEKRTGCLKECDDGYQATGSNGCTKCNRGYYCKDNKVQKCPNKYVSDRGSKTINECYRSVSAGYYVVNNEAVKCKKGTYSTKKNVYYGKSSSCIECKKGYYQNREGQSKCLKCPNGTTTKQTGATSINSCVKN